MSARPIPCLVVAYSAAWHPVAYWQAKEPGAPGRWTANPDEATAMPAAEAKSIAAMHEDHARMRGSWTHYRHAAASDHRQQEPTQ